jgi:hypothetical protein
MHGADGPFSDAVERVDVRRTGGLLDRRLGHELLELVRQELSGVVRVKGAHDLDRLGLPLTHVSVERGHVGLDLDDGFALGLHEVDWLEATVIVGEDQDVLELADDANPEGANDVGVNEPPDIRGTINGGSCVTVPSGVGFHAVRTRGTFELGYLGGNVGAVGAEALEHGRWDMEAMVKFGSQALRVEGVQVWTRFWPMVTCHVERSLGGEKSEMVFLRHAARWSTVIGNVWIRETILSDHFPEVEAVDGSLEREGAKVLVIGATEVDFPMVRKAGFGLAIFPKAVDWDEGLWKAGNAADSSDEHPSLLSFGIGGDDR